MMKKGASSTSRVGVRTLALEPGAVPRDLEVAKEVILLFGSGHSSIFTNDNLRSVLGVLGFLLSFLTG